MTKTTNYLNLKRLFLHPKGHQKFKQVNSQTLQDTVERLGKAFQGFYSRLKKVGEKAGFPRFKSYHRYDSFTLKTSGWKLDGRHLKIKGIGILKLHLSRPIEGKIKTITVRRDSCGDLCPSEGIGGWLFPVTTCQNVAFLSLVLT